MCFNNKNVNGLLCFILVIICVGCNPSQKNSEKGQKKEEIINPLKMENTVFETAHNTDIQLQQIESIQFGD